MTLTQRKPLNRKRATPRRDRHPMQPAWAMDQGRTKENTRDNAKHVAWIRTLPCTFRHLGDCTGPIQAMHVRCGTDGGERLKPSDRWTIPGCLGHHKYQHDKGEPAIEEISGVDMKATAAALYARSPYRGEDA